MSQKYLFVTGGVVSSLGKGLTAASIAMLLESRGLTVSMLKLDPYLNVDPGTMSPFQHGEVYVTDDGAETDLDLGHYSRFSRAKITRSSTATSGQVYETVIKKERKGDYLGKTVQVIPHITDEIKNRIVLAGTPDDKKTDILIVEIGGTIGDIESLPFLEALRQFRYERPGDCLNIHLTYVPYIKAAGEVKTKPTQHSVKELRAIGIIPDILLCRSESPLSEENKNKISLFCSIARDLVFDEHDVPNSIYEVPLLLHGQLIDEKICKLLNLTTKEPDISLWKNRVKSLVESKMGSKPAVKIGFVGKYLELQDAYKSVFESLQHAAAELGVKLEIIPIDATSLEQGDLKQNMPVCNGYLVPGSFGSRGILGKILTAQYCRENKVPYFGICMGMQVLCIEFARNVLKLKEANSTEINQETKEPIISLLSEQEGVTNLGGTMRLGAYECAIKKGSKAYAAYKAEKISERHRHRYEFNNAYRERFEKAGLLFSGNYEKDNLCEIVEIPENPWMVGVQFHPEFKSTFQQSHPLFLAFVKAASERA